MENNSLNEEIKRMRIDMELIKNILISEGELSNYAKKELKKARNEPKENYVSLI